MYVEAPQEHKNAKVARPREKERKINNMNNNNNIIKNAIPWERMDEIATKCLHKLLEFDYEEATEFFKDELDLTEEECKYFEVTTETEPHEFTCEDCPYHYCDDYEDYPSCHHNGEYPAPCEYEEDYDYHDSYGI